MAKPFRRIDPRVEVGHIHVTVADLDRALEFYRGVLGFEITHRMGGTGVFLSAGGYHHHVWLTTSESPLAVLGPDGPSRFALRYPTRAALGDALRRLSEAGISLEGAVDCGVTESLTLRDPDGNLLELYHDRSPEHWPRAADGSVLAVARPLDVGSLQSLAAEEEPPAGAEEPVPAAPLSDPVRARLRDLRARLLTLHKVLLDDAKAAYEMDRGRVRSNANLLQLVINDPWFAWLHPLSELVVRIDETLQPEAPATEGDGAVLLDQVARLLSPEQAPDEFARRYYEALQRQPAVVVAHAEVRRILKQPR